MAKVFTIDIGSSSVKLLEGDLKGKGLSIGKVRIVPIPAQAMNSKQKEVHDEVAAKIKSAYKEGGFKEKNAIVSMYEPLVFTRHIEMPSLSDKELQQSLKWEAERYVPLPLTEVKMDYVVTNRNNLKGNIELLLVASPLSLIEMYKYILKASGLELVVLENESLSIARVFADSSTSLLLVDMGAYATTLIVSTGENIRLSRSLGFGSETLTRAITTEQSVPYQQAESFKVTYGIDQSRGDNGVLAVLTPFIDSLCKELIQSMAYIKQRFPEEIISKVVVTGGGSSLLGLCEYISSKIQLTVEYGNPWAKYKVGKDLQKLYTGMEGLFTTATGLALRGY